MCYLKIEERIQHTQIFLIKLDCYLMHRKGVKRLLFLFYLKMN